jgi:hypothetical protein
VNIEKIHQAAVLDTDEASDVTALVSDKGSSSPEAMGPRIQVR